MKYSTFCEFFEAIEKDPTQVVEDFTVRDYLGARQHVKTCQQCIDSSDRVIARAPKDENHIGFHRN